MAVVTQTDRPKSVRCVIELFWQRFGVVILPFYFSFGVEDFVIVLNQIFSFLSYCFFVLFRLKDSTRIGMVIILSCRHNFKAR